MKFEGTAIVAWLLVALPVGLLGTSLVRGRGYGVVADFALGVLGALLGVYVIGLVAIPGEAGLVAGLLATLVGAVALPAATRLTPRRSPA